MVIGDVVVHLNHKNSPFRQICNVLFHHYCSITTSLQHSTEHVVMIQYITNLTKR